MHLRKGETMQRTLAISACAATLLSSTAMWWPGAVMAQSAASTSAGSDQIETITVTARKRAEQLLSTPVAVTAFDATTLVQRNITSLSQVATTTPSLVFEQTAGNPGDARIFIRGVGNANPATFQDPGVGVYIDGAYYGRSEGAFLDNVDIQQIEILRGPQGTLFGKNTIGGAVNVITAKPDPTDFFGTASLQYGSYNDVRGRGMINVPLDDQLAFRVSVVDEQMDGYSTNDTTGEKANNIDRLGVQAALRWTPTNFLTVDLTSMYVSDRSRGAAFQCDFVGGQASLVPTVDFLYNTNYVADCAASAARGPRHFQSDLNPSAKVNTLSNVGTVTWDTGASLGLDDLTFKAIGAWLRDEPGRVIDFDGTALPILDTVYRGLEDDTYSGEFQALGDGMGGRLNFVAGLYWSEDRSPGSGYIWTDVLPVLDLFGAPQGIYQQTKLRNESRAIYGQFTYNLDQVFSITGGLRWTDDTQGIKLIKFNAFGASPTKPFPPGAFLANNLYSADFYNLSPMGTLQATAPNSMLDGSIFDQAMAYFTVSKGFKAGGFNGNGNQTTGNVNEFKPEDVLSYELGTKWAAFDRRFEGALALYYMDYSNIQVPGIVFFDGAPQSVVNNAAVGYVDGIEFEGHALLTSSLRLDVTWTVTNAHYTKFPYLDPTTGTIIDRSQEPFAFVYPWNGSIALENQFELGDGLALTPHVEVDPMGSRYTTTSPFAPARQASRQGSLTLVNADVRLDIGPSLFLDVYGQNLTNEKYINNSLDFTSYFGTVLKYYAEPRTIGIRLQKQF